ncbi:uncharacterized protein [Nicotiana tomentosiformis]|uniref:uncharacterized protein n=1 Tax=Nicotiana tomentosiformis TaxID=4098 RepID=UPI00388C6D8C
MDVPDPGGATPPIARGRGRAPARGRGRGHPRDAPVTQPADPVEDPIIEKQGEAGIFLADPATSQAGGGAQTPTAQAPGHAAAVYQTPGTLPMDGAQPITAVALETRSAMDSDPQKLLDRWTRLHPPFFGGERHEDAQDFIDRCRDRLYNMRILESHGVDFTTSQLEGRAHRRWQSYLLGRLAGSPPMTWSQFTQLFLDMYIPPSEREELRYQFDHLEQGFFQWVLKSPGFFQLLSLCHVGEFIPATGYSGFFQWVYRPSGSDIRAADHHTEGLFRVRRSRLHEEILPRLRGKAVQQGQLPMITTSAVRPPRGGGQAGRGRLRGGGRAGGGQSATVQLGGGQPTGAPARFYAFLARPDALASDAVITSIISACGSDALILFDPGSTYSYVSSLFAHFLDIPCESLGTPIYVSTSVGNSVVVDQIYRSCVVTFCGYETRADLLLLDMIDFDVILGMDWLSPHHTILDYHAKTIILAMPALPRLEWNGSSVSTASRVISFVKARHMVEKGCLAYLAYVRDTTEEFPAIDSIPVVREFTDVFPSDLPVCDGFLALRRSGTRRACEISRLSTFGMFLFGARIAQVVALDCTDVSCH